MQPSQDTSQVVNKRTDAAHTAASNVLSREQLHGMRDLLPDAVPYVYPDGDDGYRPAASPPEQPLERYLYALLPRGEAPQDQRAAFPGALCCEEGMATLRDQVRTKRFLEAIEVGIRELRKRFPDGTLRVLDAGAGPIPVLSIAAALEDPSVQVTALELNPVSARIARGVVDALGLSQRILVVEADATSYVPQDSLHLLISETMDSGLMKEPIAAIFSNLSRYVAPDGLRIPESVTVKALLYREEHPVTQDFLATYCVRDTIHTAHDYDWRAPHAVFSWHTDCPLGEIKLEINPQVTEDDVRLYAPEGFFLVVTTSVQVLGDIELRSDDHRESRGPDSLLTIPYRRSFFSEREKRLVPWWIRTEELSRLAGAAREQGVQPRVVLSYFAGSRFGPKEITTIPPIPLEVYTGPMPDGNGD